MTKLERSPETVDSGQRNLLKPPLENQPLAMGLMAGFSGKGIRSCGGLWLDELP